MGFSFAFFSTTRSIHSMQPKWVLLALMVAAGAPCVSAAETAVLVQGPGIAVTAADVEADAQQRIPEEVRASVLSRSQNVEQMADNLYVRRAMAVKAQAMGLGADESTKTALGLARDKVLSDAYLNHFDKANAIGQAAVEAQARSMYRAKPERFQTQQQVKVRHILLQGKSPEARQKAESLLQALRDGADFVDLARKNSIDKGSADKGGELGFFARGRMAPEFENAAFQLKKTGEFSSVVETQFGLHILQLQEQRAAGQLKPFEEVKEALEREIRSNLSSQARVAEADAIRSEAKTQRAAIEAFASRHAQTGSAVAVPQKAR